MTRIVVVACGEPLRGDDGLGPAAVDGLSLGTRAMADIRTLPSLAAEDLLALPPGTTVILVDAVAGPAPGTLVRMPLDALRRSAVADPPLSGHRVPLAQTIELARVLGWDGHGAFLGLGGASFTIGESLSPPVRAALPALRTAIEQEVLGCAGRREASHGRAPTHPRDEA